MFKKLLSLFEEPAQPAAQPKPESEVGEEKSPLLAEWEYCFFRIHSPLTDKLSVAQAVGLMRALKARSANRFSLELSIVGTIQGVRWEIYLGDIENLTEEELTELISTYYPGAVAERVTMREPAQTLYRRYHVFKPQPVRYFDRALSIRDIGSEDPLVAVTRALAELTEGESMRFSLMFSSVYMTPQEEIERVLTASAWEMGIRPTGGRISTSSAEAAVGSALGVMLGRGIASARLKNQRVQRYSDVDTERFLEKLTQELAICVVSLTFDSLQPERLQAMERVYGAIQTLSSAEFPVRPGYTSPTIPIQTFDDWFTKTHHQFLDSLIDKAKTNPEEANQYWFTLTDDEGSAFWHLPHAGFPRDLLDFSGLQVAAPRNLRMDMEGVKMGINGLGSRTRDIFISPSERLAHTSISGKTGVGKSSLMHSMIHQDIAAGLGVCLFDPKGDLVRDILQHSIPPEREKDVLVLDPNMQVGSTFYPPPLNLFVSGIDADQQSEATQRLATAFTRVQKDFAEKKMASTLRQAMMAVSYQPNPTVNDVYSLLFDEEYRRRLIPRITNDIVRGYWQKFDLRKEQQQASLTEPLEWRLERFMLNSRLRAMTCHPQRLNFAKLMSANKIILISLGDAQQLYPSEEIDLIGSALLMQIDYAARCSSVTQRPFMVYVDEAQQFVDTGLPSMLSQLRSYGIGMVLANQYLAQLFGETAKAVEGNVGTLVSFELGPSDARSRVPYFEPQFTDEALTKLGLFRAALSMRDTEGKRAPAFSLEMVPPPGLGQPNPEREAYLRQRVVEQWGFKPYDEVLTLIQQRYAQHGQADIPPQTTLTIDNAPHSDQESDNDFWS